MPLMPAMMISGGLSLAGGLLGANAASDAAQSTSDATRYSADLQAKAADNALAENRRQFDIGQNNLYPFLNTGSRAVNYLGNYLMGTPTGSYVYQPPNYASSAPAPAESAPASGPTGLIGSIINSINGNGLTNTQPSASVPNPYTAPVNSEGSNGAMPNIVNFDPGQFQASPDYAFRKQEGQQGVQNYLGANGMRLSGSALKAVNRFNSNLASGEYGNWYGRQLQNYQANQNARENWLSRLMQLAGYGSGAVNTGIQAGQNYANNAGNIGMSSANALGNLATNQAATNANLNMWNANNLNNMMQSGMNNYMMYKAMSM